MELNQLNDLELACVLGYHAVLVSSESSCVDVCSVDADQVFDDEDLVCMCFVLPRQSLVSVVSSEQLNHVSMSQSSIVDREWSEGAG